MIVKDSTANQVKTDTTQRSNNNNKNLLKD